MNELTLNASPARPETRAAKQCAEAAAAQPGAPPPAAEEATATSPWFPQEAEAEHRLLAFAMHYEPGNTHDSDSIRLDALCSGTRSSGRRAASRRWTSRRRATST